MFRFSKRSLTKLEGVKPELVAVCHRALCKTHIDFGVIDGVRTEAQQLAIVEAGASKTMNSRHLTGDAADVMAYIGSRGSWELPLYVKIADAFKAAATELKVELRWGGAWHLRDIRAWDGDMDSALEDYVDNRRSRGQRPFIDAGHFELPR